ncbi:hypothetical protein QUA71_26080 [Microcoleus sp. MON1_C5]|uniref:hypothetical protein n=1 Tax=Microcoleus sp. MON1_C5 TaxID=2818828 RepID=UPI002FD54FB1
MKQQQITFEWVRDIAKIVSSRRFSNTMVSAIELLSEINALIPTKQMRLVKLNLTLTVDCLKVCQKQIYRVIQLYRNC